MDLKTKIRSIPDFPKKGIVFRDITTLLQDPVAYEMAIDQFCVHFAKHKITKVGVIESRGFIFGGPIAMALGVGLVPIRKKGKLPWDTVRQSYKLEYGTDSLEVHKDAVNKRDRVLIIDDLLATGGTAQASTKLIEKLGAKVAGLGFLIELSFLDGRKKLKEYDVLTLINYDSE
ncbi:MAG: adenine phosphoribosyltransferase [Candidatus Zixiibacteriota bacterium]